MHNKAGVCNCSLYLIGLGWLEPAGNGAENGITG